jgi:hypothetical protein
MFLGNPRFRIALIAALNVIELKAPAISRKIANAYCCFSNPDSILSNPDIGRYNIIDII